MSKPLELNTPKPLFSRRHYIWLANAARTWDATQQEKFALQLYEDNMNFKAVRWFQAVGHARAVAEIMHRNVLNAFNKMEKKDEQTW